MINKLEKLTIENEKFYQEGKDKLNKRLGVARDEYLVLLEDFNSQVDYVNKSSEYTPEGKINKNNEILNRFIDKVNYAALNHWGYLNNEISIILKECEVKKLKKTNSLNSEIMPQLMYVTTMVNNITSINDADLLESVFDYICLENNFSDEMVNIVYLKARNILNNNKVVGKDKKEVAGLGIKRSKLESIINKIENYKKDYLSEFENIAKTFKDGATNKKYPGNLYINKNIRNDFTLMSSRLNDPWKRK